MGLCHERVGSGLPILGSNRCEIGVAAYHRNQADAFRMLKEIKERTGVQVVSFDSYLCGPIECATSINGIPLYRDKWHLSHRGSVALAKGFDLKSRIDQGAK
jgi:hypothetical protein